MTKKVLSTSEKELAKQFSILKKSSDFVQVNNSSTRGSVLFSTFANAQNLKSLDELLDLNGNSAIEEAYKKKYREKLAEVAKQKGYNSVDTMMADQKKKDHKNSLNREPVNLSMKEKSEEAQVQTNEKHSARIATNLPPHVKTLNEIVKLDLLKNETPEKIGEIWNTYHSTRNCISACLDSTFFDTLVSKSKLFPMFVLPLPRNDGFEIFFLQFQGHQIFFTQLLEYQINKENARPCLSISFYNELAKEKGVVLMLGELAKNDGPVSLKDAQNLIYQLQIFYVTGNQLQKRMLETFWKDPQNFKYEDLIESLQQL